MKVTCTCISFTWLEFKHPVTQIYDRSFSSVVGEDIEHANKGLSQSSKGVRGQADVFLFSFTSLGRFTWPKLPIVGCDDRSFCKFKRRCCKVRSLRGFTENDKRLIHHLDSKEVLKVIQYLFIFYFLFRPKPILRNLLPRFVTGPTNTIVIRIQRWQFHIYFYFLPLSDASVVVANLLLLLTQWKAKPTWRRLPKLPIGLSKTLIGSYKLDEHC